MASASLSGISMLNSCAAVSAALCERLLRLVATDLLNGHDDLYRVEAVETEVVVEVRLAVEL